MRCWRICILEFQRCLAQCLSRPWVEKAYEGFRDLDPASSEYVGIFESVRLCRAMRPFSI